MIRLCTLVASALVFLNPLWAAAAERPPNIVLIMADDVGCETLGCYGGQSYKLSLIHISEPTRPY